MTMTKKTVGMAALAIISFAACKKENKTTSVKDNLLGTWTQSNEAKDANGNGVMDAGEVGPAALYEAKKLTYSPDSKFSILTYNNKLAGEKKWELLYDDTYMRMTDLNTGANVVYQHIDKITATDLTLKDTTGGVTTWYQFVKG